MDTLISIRQKKGESLRNNINRFNVTILEIYDLDQTVIMSTMKDRLRHSIFIFNLKKKFPADDAELLTRAEKYSNAEEAMAARRDALTNRVERGNKRRREEPSDRD